MKYIICFCFVLFSTSTQLYGQAIRVNNSFIIVANDRLADHVMRVQLVLTDTNGKDDVIEAGYFPGELYVDNIKAKNVLFADSTKKLTLKFDISEYRRSKQIIHNYKIPISIKWFKPEYFILRLKDTGDEKYKYALDVAGIHFALPYWIAP